MLHPSSANCQYFTDLSEYLFIDLCLQSCIKMLLLGGYSLYLHAPEVIYFERWSGEYMFITCYSEADCSPTTIAPSTGVDTDSTLLGYLREFVFPSHRQFLSTPPLMAHAYVSARCYTTSSCPHSC